MAFVFQFPDVGEGIHEGRLVEWLVAEGATVAEDQALCKVETDKAVVELPSPRAGTVVTLHVAAGDTIHVDDPLVTIGADGEAAPVAPAAVVEMPHPPQEATPPARPAAGNGQRPPATPRTRALARQLGVDLGTVRGSGRGGRITDEDVERSAAGSQAPLPAPAPLPPPAAAMPAAPPVAREATADGPVERVPLSHLRKVIATAMRESKHTSAHVTHVDEADVTELLAAHRRVKARIEADAGVRFTLLPFFVKALVEVLKRYPAFNASVDEARGELVLKRYYNIGIAVDTPEGLIVPVLKGVDRMDMVTIAREVADLAERARQRRLSLDELRGGTCTLTNIGPLGGVFATPIIRQPELAIVGLHAIKERPAVVDGQIAIRSQMYLSVSFDHRYVDGADAARFMSELVRLVSEPSLLMVRL
jgi:pyruvate dehydrogenase E2 component (dihydrolipoamide acetyltransferase)